MPHQSHLLSWFLSFRKNPPVRCFSSISPSWIAVLVALLLSNPQAYSQKGEWEWVSGNRTLPNNCGPSLGDCGRGGVYGHAGVTEPRSLPGGRSQAATWVDSKGRLWMFGGYGFDSTGRQGFLNDLWVYDPSTGEWTWMSGSNKAGQAAVYGKQGIPARSNTPGGGTGSTWTDPDGNHWLYDSPDLWEFNPATRQWTWIGNVLKCPANERQAARCPGDRAPAASWIDRYGNLWIFGGTGEDQVGAQGYLNDLWRYDVANKQWMMMAGSLRYEYIPSPVSINPNKGVYGTCGNPGVFNADYSPGSRIGSYSWSDAKGHLWLFGGMGFDCSAYDPDDTFGNLNDLWEFDPGTRRWAYMGGSPWSDENAVVESYGSMGAASAQNLPGQRNSGMSWTSGDGYLWLYGGAGDATGGSGYLNDLWVLNPVVREWEWVNGSDKSMSAFTATWGTKGVASPAGNPGPRTESSTWTDAQGNLWLFGGSGANVNGTGIVGMYNDLWRFTPQNPTTWPAATPTFSIAPGNYNTAQTLRIYDITPGSAIYYTTNGKAPTTRSPKYTGKFSVTDSETVNAIAAAPGYNTSATLTGAFNILKPQTIDWPRITGTYAVGTMLNLQATASSGLPVTFTSEFSDYHNVCSVSGNTVSFLYAGTCFLYANQGGNDIYQAAPGLVQSVTVAKSQ